MARFFGDSLSHLGWAAVLGCWIVLGIGCGNDDSPKPEAESEGTSTAQAGEPTPDETENTPASAKSDAPAEGAESEQNSIDPKAQLLADVDDAISQLEAGHFAVFIEHYMPVEDVRSLRETDEVERFGKTFKPGGQFQEEWLTRLKALKTGTVEFLNKEKSLAKISGDLSGNPPPRSSFSLANPAEEKVPATEGFAGDLPKVIEQAIAALEAKEYQKFAENMFPPAELGQAVSEEGRQTLLKKLEEHPQMAETMLADLKTLQEQKPEFDSQQTVATYELTSEEAPARTIRFEKAGTWRFANTAKTIRTQMYEQSQQPPVGFSQRLETKWERIRGHWRLYETE